MPKTSKIARRNTIRELFRGGYDASSILKLTKMLREQFIVLWRNSKKEKVLSERLIALEVIKKRTPRFLSGFKKALKQTLSNPWQNWQVTKCKPNDDLKSN